MRTWAVAFALLAAGPAWAQDAQAGRSLYTAKCTACHGAAGKGDGPAALALPTRPRDMTSPGFWEGMADEKLRGVITNGTPGGIMRGFPMGDDDLADLVAYVRTFQPD